MTSPASDLALVPFESYLVMESTSEKKHEWINGDIKRAGETITIHGAVISVDAIYA